MSEDGEKTCPLCAEEMDLTDQQLKPCKCGYEICVWCWHHLMEMAEKDGTEGRCPACRTPYDKEKIVGTAGKCERVVAEQNMERKRSQKTKYKSAEGRKQLNSVRVIQRNLVYIVGLPLHLGDEDLLQHREYFGQYGKVLKVSMSRTATGVIQQFPNNTCSVYITYTKEEEAIRCIQSVHGFTLEDRPLRACFGTTKYCHAWLRNVPCSNPDCLYLHEIGSQEDSFTKDEVISAYTRYRVQQITGAAYNQQRCSGNVLPPPLDNYNSLSSTAKPIIKNTSGNVASAKGSSPNESSGRPIGLPPAASWAARASNSQPPTATIACSNRPLKQTVDKAGGALALSSAVASTAQDPSSHDACDKPTSNDKSGKLDMWNSKQYVHSSPSTSSYENPSALDGLPVTEAISDQLLSPSSTESDQGISLPSNTSNSVDISEKSSGSSSEEGSDRADGDMQYLCTDDYSSMSLRNEYSSVVRDHPSLREDVSTVTENKVQRQSDFEWSRELPALPRAEKASLTTSGYVSCNPWDLSDSPQSEMLDKCSEADDDIVAFNKQRLKDPEVVCPSSYLPNSSNILSSSNHSRSQSFQHNEGIGSVSINGDPLFVDGIVTDGSAMPFLGSIIPNAPENTVQSSCGVSSARPPLSGYNGFETNIGMPQENATNSSRSLALDGESSIISNILSLDLDELDDSLTSPQNLAHLLGENDGRSGSLGRILSSRKVQDNNLSRFSFARQEDSKGQTLDVDQLFSVFGQFPTANTYGSNSSGNRELYTELGAPNGFSSNSLKESNNLSSTALSSNNFPAPRAPISAPPGFSVPSRAPPPGFTSHERVEQAYDTAYGNNVREASSMLRNSYHLPTVGTGNANDLEFQDPAILKAVERGVQSGGSNYSDIDVRSSYHQQCNNAFENEAKLQLLMQRSLSQHQNLRYPDIRDNYSLVNDPYGVPSRFLNQSQVNLSNPYGFPSRLLDQSQVNNISPFGQAQLQQSMNSVMAHGHWNELQGGSNLSIAELLRNERLGYKKFYPSYEDTKFCMPSSGDLYNRTYGL